MADVTSAAFISVSKRALLFNAMPLLFQGGGTSVKDKACSIYGNMQYHSCLERCHLYFKAIRLSYQVMLVLSIATTFLFGAMPLLFKAITLEFKVKPVLFMATPLLCMPPLYKALFKAITLLFEAMLLFLAMPLYSKQYHFYSKQSHFCV